MKGNYLMLNGKRIDLTDEQIEKLGLEIKKETPFDRQSYYYCILEDGVVDGRADVRDVIDDRCYNIANYCTDKSLMQQRALHEVLDRLLWRFSMQNDGDKIICKKMNDVFTIMYHATQRKFIVNSMCSKYHVVYFYTEEIAQRAIDEIILPFMEEHPEFIW